MSATIARPAENLEAHYYTADGKPMHWVPCAKGDGMRPTRIDDARKLSLRPSATTILKILNKPQLINWMIEQAVLSVLTAPRHDQEPLDAFIQRVLHDEGQQDQERHASADLGSRIHAELEYRLINHENDDCSLCVYTDPVYSSVMELGRLLATEKIVVSEHYAGRFDALIEGNDLWLIDFKTCKTMPGREPWPEHKLQLAAYANALGNTGDKRLRCANIYISTTEPGTVKMLEVENWPDEFENGFRPALQVWRHLNKIG